MNKELTEKLWNKFPLLYRDKSSSVQTSLIPFGFECGPGWYNLIWELSSKLEPLIQKWIDENKSDNCAQCGCEKTLHESDFGPCWNIHYLPHIFSFKWKPYGWPSPFGRKLNWKERWLIFKNKYIRYHITERSKRWITRTINFILSILDHQFGITNKKPCWCKGYTVNHPCASQVKEKFAGLCFYMTSSTNEMQKLIDEAEKKSYHICEECGADGEVRNDCNWLTTLCEVHAVDRDEKRIPTCKELEEEENNLTKCPICKTSPGTRHLESCTYKGFHYIGP